MESGLWWKVKVSSVLYIIWYIQNFSSVLHVRLNADDSIAVVLHPTFTLILVFCWIDKHALRCSDKGTRRVCYDENDCNTNWQKTSSATIHLQTGKMLTPIKLHKLITKEHLAFPINDISHYCSLSDCVIKVYIWVSRDYNSDGIFTCQLNLLIATKVGEEGLDIQTCCLVIRFDLPETVASFIQSRGRARMAQSEYAFLVDRCFCIYFI